MKREREREKENRKKIKIKTGIITIIYYVEYSVFMYIYIK
jgi:hypothetical protein